MKKGTIHLDWIISIGIFLIYILFFFVFISPFYKSPTQEGVIMLDILEDNLREEVYWNITRVPVFIDCKNKCQGGSAPDGIEDICLPSFPFEWSWDKIMLVNDTADPVNINFEIDENCGDNGLAASSGNYITDLTFNYDLINDMQVFWIIYNEEASYPNVPWVCNYQGEDDCIFLEYKDNGAKDYVYYYGLAEEIFGIGEHKLAGLDYEGIKEKWRFPEGADFGMKVIYLEDNTPIFKLNIEESAEEDYKYKAYEQANIYVREWTDYILNEKGTKDAVKINIAVWR